jgi:DNA polymerase-3 subunit delta'
MRWDEIIGQEPLQRMLQRCIINGRIPQALLLTGQEGAGTVALALAFARTVNCERPITADDRIAPCESCHGCKQSRTLQHPNIRIVPALPAGKDAARAADGEDGLSDDVLDELREGIVGLAEDPYSELRLTNATTIRIGQIRELKRSLSLSAMQEGRRVVIILNAEEMNGAAANAFLKTLEEPHPDVTIILTSSRPERLLQTIVSRCQELIVPPLDDDAIAAALVRRGLCSADEARMVAPFAQGNLQRAAGFLSEDVRGLRDAAVELLRSALKGKDFRNGLVDAADAAVDGRNRVRAEALLALMAAWLRDAVAVGTGGPDAPIMNGDQRDALDRFHRAFGTADLPSVLAALERASRDISRNVSIHLVLVTAMLEVRRIIAATRAHQPTA